jgi:hypothetical protein
VGDTDGIFVGTFDGAVVGMDVVGIVVGDSVGLRDGIGDVKTTAGGTITFTPILPVETVCIPGTLLTLEVTASDNEGDDSRLDDTEDTETPPEGTIVTSTSTEPGDTATCTSL